jgi:protocatechuate 3,4-dioxygenase beta subunit
MRRNPPARMRPSTQPPSPRRRQFVLGGVAAVITFPAFAQQCRVTPRDALGPFYSRNAPEQNDLCASGSGGKARLVVSGRVLGAPDCKPLAGALVEVWHADANGDYSEFTRGKKDDPACLLRASLKTDAEGRYRFSTIVPAEYPGRPRHIHYRVSHAAHTTLVTQLYFERERGVAEQLVVPLSRDDKGVSSALFDVTLMRSGAG